MAALRPLLLALAALVLVAQAERLQQLDFTDGTQDDVDKMIKGLVSAVKSGDSSVFGGAKATVMANNNVLNHKEAPKPDSLAIMAATREEGRKADAEEHMKSRMEQKQKGMEDRSKKRIQKKKLLLREQSIKQEAEEDKKTASEEDKKYREVSQKKKFEETTKAAVKRARKKAIYEQKKAIMQMDQQKAKAEQQRLVMKQQNQKALELALQAAQKVKEKEKEQEDVRLAQEQQSKKKIAEQEKLVKAQKRAAQLKKLQKKKTAVGTHCGCEEKIVDFRANSTWASCPTGTLLAGISRDRHNSLRGVTALYCCKPCRDDGTTALSVGQCAVTSWYSAMKNSATGFASCPDNSFIQGLYKGGCNSLSCLEQVKCCFLDGSSGMTRCKNTDAGLQNIGWMRARKNAFISGLKKTEGSTLPSISTAKQCRFFAYP